MTWWVRWGWGVGGVMVGVVAEGTGSADDGGSGAEVGSAGGEVSAGEGSAGCVGFVGVVVVDGGCGRALALPASLADGDAVEEPLEMAQAPAPTRRASARAPKR